ncbi:MAG: hypothetical protein U0903_10755 [Planctomycetales bacterium]
MIDFRSRIPNTLFIGVVRVLLLAALLAHTGSFPGTSPLQAADKKPQLPVRIDVEPAQLPVRSSSFYPIRCKLTHLHPGIFTGSLKLTGTAYQRLLFQLQTPEFAVSDQTLELLINLPPVSTAEGSMDLKVDLLEGTGRKIGTEEFNLIVSRSTSRRMIVGYCQPPQRSLDPRTNDLLTSFNLQAGLPTEARSSRDSYGFEVASTLCDPLELSENPLEITRYDILILMEDAWPTLKDKQKTALLEWVNSGGSLCVIASNHPPREAYPFLIKLAGRDIPLPLPTVPDSEPVLKEILSRRLGLGRIVILPRKLLDELDLRSETWRKQVGFLWKARQGHRAGYLKNGKWDESRIFVKAPNGQPQVEYYNMTSRPLSVPLLRSFDQLLWQLKPPDMGMIPLSWLLSSLGIYVLLIGPVDYYLLGLFRARKWTWVVFPLVTLGFTWGMFAVTNRVMGFNDQTRSITLIDLADPNFARRVNQLELRMFSMPQTVHSERKQELQTLLDWQQSGMMMPQMAGNDDRTLDEQAPRYVGRIPSNSDMVQYVRQWAPQFRRGMRLESDLPIPEFPWDRFADARKYPAAKLLQDAALCKEITQAATETFGREISVYLFQGNQSQLLAGRPVLQTSRNDMLQGAQTAMIAQQTIFNPYEKSFLDSLCVYPQEGMFKLVSQISPTGGRTLEDLPLLDPDDPDQWLLVIAVPDKTDLKIYRRRYGGADSW